MTYLQNLNGVFFHVFTSEDVDDITSCFFMVVCAVSLSQIKFLLMTFFVENTIL